MNYRSSWYILHINPLSVIWFINIFSHSWGCLSSLFISFAVQDFLVWCRTTVSFLWLLPLILVSYPRTHYYTQCNRALYLCFLLLVFTASGPMFKSLIHLELILCMVQIRVQFHSFAYRYSALSAPFVEENILSHCMFLASLVKTSWPYMNGIISGLYAVPFISMSVIRLVSYYFNNCTFVIQFEIRKYDDSQLCSFSLLLWLLNVFV